MAVPFSLYKLTVEVWGSAIGSLKPPERFWLPVTSYILAPLLTMTILYVLDVPQGLMPFLPALIMLGVPHSYRLGLLRITVMLMGCIIAYVITLLFMQQPWFLFPIVLLQIFVGMYLLKRGLDKLAAILYIFLPVIIAWSGFSGQNPGPVAWDNARGLLVGIITCELLMILLKPRRVEERLIAIMSTKLRELASSFGKGRAEGEKAGWTPAWSANLNLFLQMLTQQRGNQDASVKRFYALAATVRLLLGLNHTRFKFIRFVNYETLGNIAQRAWEVYQAR